MTRKTEQLIAALDNSAVKIATVQSLLRSGHELAPEELTEWIEYVSNQNAVYHAMLMILIEEAELPPVIPLLN